MPSSKNGCLCKILEEDLKEQEYWNSALIGYVLGDTQYLKSMETYILNAWNFVNKPQIVLHDEEYLQFKFDTVEDCEMVLQAGQFMFFNKPLVLQKWEIDFEFDPDCITTVPWWLTLPVTRRVLVQR